jgi:hypothetical protein
MKQPGVSVTLPAGSQVRTGAPANLRTNEPTRVA